MKKNALFRFVMFIVIFLLIGTGIYLGMQFLSILSTLLNVDQWVYMSITGLAGVFIGSISLWISAPKLDKMFKTNNILGLAALFKVTVGMLGVGIGYIMSLSALTDLAAAFF